MVLSSPMCMCKLNVSVDTIPCKAAKHQSMAMAAMVLFSSSFGNSISHQQQTLNTLGSLHMVNLCKTIQGPNVRLVGVQSSIDGGHHGKKHHWPG